MRDADPPKEGWLDFSHVLGSLIKRVYLYYVVHINN